MMASTYFRTAFAAVALVVLTGCATVHDLYPQFKQQSASLKSVAITTDLLVLEDVRGPLPLVDVPRMTAIGAQLNDYFKSEFEKRGITVVETEHAAIGLRYANGTPPPFKVRRSEDIGKPLDALETARAPWWLAGSFSEPSRRGKLANALEDLQRKPLQKGMTNLVSASGRELGAAENVTHRVFVLIEGVQVPLSKGLTQGIVTGLLSLGTVTVFEMTNVSFRVGIMDTSTGEFIMITDCTLAGGWTVDDAYLKKQGAIFFAQLDHLRRGASPPL